MIFRFGNHFSGFGARLNKDFSRAGKPVSFLENGFMKRRIRKHSKGYTLIELIITITVLSILVLTALPLAQNAVRRQKEQRLREALREMRMAIDEFKRDTLGACQLGQARTTNPTDPRGNFAQNVPVDPRSRVVIDDCEIFTADNLDRYPPSLEILVEGVTVKPRGLNIKGGGVFSDETTVFSDAPKEIKKVYLREIPVDPITGEKNWVLRSSYQSSDVDSWDGINVFDVRSASEEEALNGEKYKDW